MPLGASWEPSWEVLETSWELSGIQGTSRKFLDAHTVINLDQLPVTIPLIDTSNPQRYLIFATRMMRNARFYRPNKQAGSAATFAPEIGSANLLPHCGSLKELQLQSETYKIL